MKISNNLSLPKNAVTQKLAMLGRTGSGKSYAAGKLVELMLDKHAQVVILDPVGIWWGLRLLSDGKTPSPYSLPVLGGLHGDIPLEPSSGNIIADLIVDKTISMVIDIIETFKFKLGKCEREIYEVLLSDPDTEYTKEELAQTTATQYSPTSGGFSNSLSKLNTLELLVRQNGKIKLNPELKKML